MNIRLALKLILIIACLVAASPVWAQPGSLTAVTPDDVAKLEMMHQRATDLLLINDFQGAIRIYSDILLLEPDDETAYTGLGQIYMVLGQFKKANEAFENALHINPDNQVALLGIQKILDPDGIEGMVSRTQTEAEEGLRLAEMPQPAKMAPIPQTPGPVPFIGFAHSTARYSAQRGKVTVQPIAAKPTTPQPVQSLQPAPIAQPVKPAAPPTIVRKQSKILTGFGRPGFLHAQRVQMALRNARFYEGPVNGLIGPTTKKALMEFQKHRGLTPNGKVTTRTWAALTNSL